MSSIIQNKLQQALGDGARATKFEVFLGFRDIISGTKNEDLITLVKTTSFPGKSHNTIDFKYKGRSIPIKGQTKYSQVWECAFYLTEDHKLKRAFESWIEALDQKHNYQYDYDLSAGGVDDLQRDFSKNGYTTSIDLYQKSFDDKTQLAKYTLFNVYPIEVSSLQYSYESLGQIQEFTVTFSYSHFTSEVLKGKEGNFIDTLVGKFKNAVTNAITSTTSAIGDAINSMIDGGQGNILDDLNNWAKGVNIDLTPPLTSNTITDLISGGLSDKWMPTSIYTQVAETASATANGITSSLSNAASTVSSTVSGAVTSATSKIKSFF